MTAFNCDRQEGLPSPDLFCNVRPSSARVVELADTPDLGSGVERRAGSSPVPGTSVRSGAVTPQLSDVAAQAAAPLELIRILQNGQTQQVDILKFRISDPRMSKTVTVSEASRGFSDLINRVRYQGETAILVKGGKPVAKIVPMLNEGITGKKLAELWGTRPHLSAEEAKVLEKEIAAAKKLLPKLKDKWA
jgi:prevent-host-death family protein